MATRILLTANVRHVLKHAHPSARKAIRRVLAVIKNDWPSSQQIDIKRLMVPSDRGPVFRVRAGSWRIVVRPRGQDLEVVRIFPRREGYGWMERT